MRHGLRLHHITFSLFDISGVCFAAVHISNMSPAQQVEHFKRHKEGRFKVVLRFLGGLNKLSRDAAVGIDLVQWLFEA